MVSEWFESVATGVQKYESLNGRRDVWKQLLVS